MRRALIVLLLAGCSPKPSPGPTRLVKDSRGKEVAVPLKPARIVSIVPGCTELLFAAGAGAQVVGVTTYCGFPAEAATRTKVGDLSVNYEVLASLRPDLVVASNGLVPSSVASIESLGTPVFCIDPAGFDDIARALRTLGELTGNAEAGEAAAKELEARVAAVERRVAGKTRRLVVMELTSRVDVAVPGTYGHDVIVRARGRNAFDDLKGPLFAPVTWEAIVARDPEVYVVGHDDTNRPASRRGASGMRARFVEIEPRWLVFPTPRLARGLELVAEALHP
jgi:iron complex transport system substrate-binding protein